MRASSRGYVLMIVVVMGVVLASLAGTLLYAVTRDRTEGKLQTSSVRAVYASEAAVAVGIEKLRGALEETVSPDLATIEADATTAVTSALPGATFPTLSVRYFDAATNSASITPFGTSALTAITTGVNKGLLAQQTPIQVFAVAQVDQAMASVADAIRVDLIPVFQFAMFFDGDFEMLSPAPITVAGRVHTNGNFYVSGGFNNEHHIQGNVTIAGVLHGRSAADPASTVSDIDILQADGTELNISSSFPFSPASTQKTEIEKWGGSVSDSSTGAQPLTIPLRLTDNATCTSNATCGAGKSCVKVRATDTSGVCTVNVVSRPDVCGSGSSASFPQSLAVQLIKRPKVDYANTGILAPYKNVAVSSPYAADFGPKPAIPASASLNSFNDFMRVGVSRSVPLVQSTVDDDDPGARLDRMYWKADVRIIDGVWYRKNRIAPIFDPESDGYTTSETMDPNDVRHKFARVLRYSWWWDSRESRVYCSTSDAGQSANENCIASGDRYQRGLQIRATDFDMAAFMALLDDSAARAQLFPLGVPGDGVIVYVSETYNPHHEDMSASAFLPASANVRNFLNFPVMHNHLSSAADIAAAYTTAAISRTNPSRNEAANSNPPTPYELGWIPENIWGRRAPTNFESLTRPKAVSGSITEAMSAAEYSSLPPAGTGNIAASFKNGSSCGLTTSDYTDERRPASRPTTFSTPSFSAPCIRAGATPLGPENAVRLIRGQTVPAGGFTLVTDNRLYVQGDVNVRQDSAVVSGSFSVFQDIPGSVSLVADSVSILSSRFTEVQYQGPLDGFHRAPASYASAAQWSAVQPGRVPYDGSGTTAGEGPANFCSLTASPYETFINASLLMGDVPACVDAGSAIGNLSGGVNNFPRFVEHWASTVPLHINGSMVSLFRSEMGNSRFVNSGYGAFSAARGAAYPDNSPCIYTPPKRRWMFDNTLLDDISNLPPGTPRVVATDRLRWVRR
jgi:hypothetical protein